jgi:hypothetical protein
MHVPVLHRITRGFVKLKKAPMRIFADGRQDASFIVKTLFKPPSP